MSQPARKGHSTRADQVRLGSLNRWKARYGMTEAEVAEARELAVLAKLPMDVCCRDVVRRADKRTGKRSVESDRDHG